MIGTSGYSPERGVTAAGLRAAKQKAAQQFFETLARFEAQVDHDYVLEPLVDGVNTAWRARDIQAVATTDGIAPLEDWRVLGVSPLWCFSIESGEALTPRQLAQRIGQTVAPKASALLRDLEDDRWRSMTADYRALRWSPYAFAVPKFDSSHDGKHRYNGALRVEYALWLAAD